MHERENGESSRKRSNLAGPNYGNWVRHYLAVVIPPCRGGPLAIHERSLDTFSNSANILMCGCTTPLPRPVRPANTHRAGRPSLMRTACNKCNGVALKPGTSAGPDSRNAANLDPLTSWTAHSVSPSVRRLPPVTPDHVVDESTRGGKKVEREKREVARELLDARELQLESMIYNEDQDIRL